MKVMVLAGGPDREREVSLMSGEQVSAALREAGHEVIQRDLSPDDTAALEEFAMWCTESPGPGVVFPIFHGKWGEGGGAQQLLDQRGLPYVGCREAAARLCTDKTKTKQTLLDAGLPTPAFELVNADDQPTLDPPVVVKPNDDGSSIDLAICHDAESLDAAWADLSSRNDVLLVERFVRGKEITVGVIEDETGSPVALPSIHIVPATEFYDYEAKYIRDDTQYHFDTFAPELEAKLGEIAVAAFKTLGCRHLSRIDMFVDEDDQPWVIEVNTLPGFTTHSLLPMGAAKQGTDMPGLVDRLVNLAVNG
ncbi:D-alanine--D-alanine ligase family protein [Algisphaera agarilytica]|uniref:D-alanine--D-alanine ligase n=1 Tax=Algisphaera agarilytica TaxID=1385975 RepID=A0A7X0H592_9BACT|nr:D-alanine--D-alanine ligase [Algisphaera agarilytica]MBB6429537.1 D-alanine-D-alanine ligase [Algisphaera agarilytica]